MKPVEHYREAERLLTLAATPTAITLPAKISEEEAEAFKERFQKESKRRVEWAVVPDPVRVDMSATLVAAQVHATLALAGSQLRSLADEEPT